MYTIYMNSANLITHHISITRYKSIPTYFCIGHQFLTAEVEVPNASQSGHVLNVSRKRSK